MDSMKLRNMACTSINADRVQDGARCHGAPQVQEQHQLQLMLGDRLPASTPGASDATSSLTRFRLIIAERTSGCDQAACSQRGSARRPQLTNPRSCLWLPFVYPLGSAPGEGRLQIDRLHASAGSCKDGAFAVPDPCSARARKRARARLTPSRSGLFEATCSGPTEALFQ